MSAPLPVLRSLSGKPPTVTRMLSSRSALIDGLRELVRQDSVRELLVRELGPLLRERQSLDRLSYAWRHAFFALLALALWATWLQRAAQPPSAADRAPVAATVLDAEDVADVRSRQIGLVALSTCGAIAGICLSRWSPAARIQMLVGRTAAQQALSAGVKGLAQHSRPLAGRAVGPAGQLLRLVRALLPASPFEWLLVLFNLSLIAGVGSVWSFARSPAFKTVVDSIQLVVSRTEFLRRLGAFGDASKLKLEKLAMRFGNGNVHMQAMRAGPHQISGLSASAAGAGERHWRAARRWWGQLGIGRRPAVIATSLPRST